MHTISNATHGNPLVTQRKVKIISFLLNEIFETILTLFYLITFFYLGGWQDRLKDRFLGMTLQLKTPSLLANGDDRFELLTESLGTVNVQIHIIAKNFVKFGCQL